MLTRSCQCSLHAQRGLPMLVIGRKILIGGAPVGPQLLAFVRPAGTVERFGVQRSCCRDYTALDQRPQAPRHLGVTHPRGGARIDQITRDQRHTSPRSSGSAMLSRPPCSSHSIWRARADVAATCCSAVRTVSETPVVLSSRCAAESRSSSRSISRFGTRPPLDRVYIASIASIYSSGRSLRPCKQTLVANRIDYREPGRRCDSQRILILHGARGRAQSMGSRNPGEDGIDGIDISDTQALAAGHLAAKGRDGESLDADQAKQVLSRRRVRDIRREVIMMRAFQSRLIGPVLRRLGGPESLL